MLQKRFKFLVECSHCFNRLFSTKIQNAQQNEQIYNIMFIRKCNTLRFLGIKCEIKAFS